MAFSFNAFFIFAFLFFQTSVAPKIGFLRDIFDLMIVLVVYAAIYRPIKESVVFIMLMGVLIDNISSSPLGLYVTVYIWLFVGVRWIIRYLYASNVVLIPLIIAGSIVYENLLVIALMALFEKTFYLHSDMFTLIMTQVLWGLLMGPLLLLFVKNFRTKWETLYFEKISKYFG